MCEITNGKMYVADRDLVCYKIMLEMIGGLESLHKGYRYEIGQECCVKGFEYRSCLSNYILYEGWYIPLTWLGEWKKDVWRKDYTVYPNTYVNAIKTDLYYTHFGFYSYTYYGNGKMERDLGQVKSLYGGYCPNPIKLVRCRIPEGSKYMVSDDGEVFISERIVVDEKLTI
jgi:hypothetical protein